MIGGVGFGWMPDAICQAGPGPLPAVFLALVFLPGVAAVPPSRERESLLVHLLLELRSPG